MLPNVVMHLGRTLILAAALGIVLSALADPPPHAPAHGWRKKNDPYHVGYTGHKWERDYGIIGGRCDREAIGAVVGGAIGGTVGSRVGEGSERTVAIVVGTVIGAVIGREIGQRLDDRDRACIGHALELAHDGQSVRWLNERTGVAYVLTPAPARRKASGCRDYSLTLSLGGRSRTQAGQACRQGEGDWQIALG